jgi:hypothetical protein
MILYPKKSFVMKKPNEQLESHPLGNNEEQAFNDQRRGGSQREGDSQVNDDEEEDGSPVLDETDLEENNISEDESEKIEWGPEGKSGGQKNSPQHITNAADTGSNNKGTDDDVRTGSNTMRTPEPPIK